MTEKPQQNPESLWAEIVPYLSSDRWIGAENLHYDKDGNLVAELPKEVYRGDEYAEGMSVFIASLGITETPIKFVVKAAHASDEWEIKTLADAYKPRPPVEYIVDGLYPLPSLSITYGPPGSFKSLLMADMAICVAAGLDWLPSLPNQDAVSRKVLQSTALWVDFDNGIRPTEDRIEALARTRDLLEDTPIHYVSMPYRPLDGTDPESIDYLINRIRELDAKLVIIDSLLDVMGDADENTAAAGKVIGQFRRVSEETGAAVILIHHPRKPTGTKGRAGYMLRGHTSIEGKLDLALLVEREDHSDTCTVQSTKTRYVDVFPFGAMWTYEHKDGTKDLKTCKFFGCEPEAKKDNGLTIADAKHRIENVVKSFPNIFRGKLVEKAQEATGKGINTLQSYIDAMVRNETLIETEGPNNKKLYSIP